MAICNSTRTASIRAHSQALFPRLYRAFISAESYGIERTAFVEAASHQDAIRRIANAVAAVELRLPQSVEDRIYNCSSAAELIDDGMSEDVELRLFETGWNGKAICFVDEPLFLLSSAALIRRWAQISEVSYVEA